MVQSDSSIAASVSFLLVKVVLRVRIVICVVDGTWDATDAPEMVVLVHSVVVVVGVSLGSTK